MIQRTLSFPSCRRGLWMLPDLLSDF